MSETYEDLVSAAEEALDHKDFEVARQKFEAALAARPYPCSQKSRLHRRIGELAYRSNDLKLARQHLTTADEGYSRRFCSCENREAHERLLILLAHVHRDLGELEQSKEVLGRAQWNRELIVLERWRLANQLLFVALSVGGLLLGLTVFWEIGLSFFSLIGMPVALFATIAGALAGAAVAMALGNVSGPVIVRWKLRQTMRGLAVRNPIKIE